MPTVSVRVRWSADSVAVRMPEGETAHTGVTPGRSLSFAVTMIVWDACLLTYRGETMKLGEVEERVMDGLVAVTIR